VRSVVPKYFISRLTLSRRYNSTLGQQELACGLADAEQNPEDCTGLLVRQGLRKPDYAGPCLPCASRAMESGFSRDWPWRSLKHPPAKFRRRHRSLLSEGIKGRAHSFEQHVSSEGPRQARPEDASMSFALYPVESLPFATLSSVLGSCTSARLALRGDFLQPLAERSEHRTRLRAPLFLCVCASYKSSPRDHSVLELTCPRPDRRGCIEPGTGRP